MKKMEGEYENSRVAVDSVILTIHENKLKIFLHKREKDPYKDKMELPGGLVKKDETAEQTLKRKVKELFGFDNVYFSQFKTFTEPKRDPRERTISIGFIALIDEHNIRNIQNWYDINTKEKLAFDHNEVIQEARIFLKKHVGPELVKSLLPERFPLNDLQKVYELIENIKYDNRNFRKKILSSNIIKETGELERNVSHRPAKLFAFK
jgi:8-oxo-dGTP diphosphatase